MKQKKSDIFAIISTVFAILALLMNLLIYYGAQSFFLRIFTTEGTHVTNVPATIYAILMATPYVLACAATVGSKKRGIGLGSCIIALIFTLFLEVVYKVLFASFQATVYAGDGATYLAAWAALENAGRFFEAPFFIMARIFLCIALGTLTIKAETGGEGNGWNESMSFK